MKRFFVALLFILSTPVFSAPEETFKGFFVHQDGKEYGYETDTGDVLMLSYLGKRDNTYQFLENEGGGSATVYVIKYPHDFVKAVSLWRKKAIGKETFRLNDTALEWALVDAKSGKLDQMLSSDGKTMIWIDENNQLTYPPLPAK